MKDQQYSDENELRVSLSALGIGEFALADGRKMDFPPNLQLSFDYRNGLASGAMREIRLDDQAQRASVSKKLASLGIAVETKRHDE